MRRYICFYWAAVVLLLAGFSLYIGIQQMPRRPSVDVAAVNRIARQAAGCWDNLNQLEQMTSEYRFVIIDTDGNVRYASAEGLPGSSQAALRQGVLPIDVSINTGVAGKAFIETYSDDVIDRARKSLSTAIVVAFLVLCLAAAFVLLVIHCGVIKPFARLERFAHKISTGKFDDPLPMDRNNLFGLFTQSLDIMRASLLEAQQKQLAAERAQKELIASLNHDIKTPITSIKLTSELLQAIGRDAAVTETLKEIDAKADQISRLMNDMLQSTLEELGKMSVTPVSHPSHVLLPVFRNADTLSKADICDIPACMVELDIARMEQVIDNIISNSYKYAETDIKVSAKVQDGFLQIDINDFGCGVNAEELELICTKFYRGENAGALHKEGEGLGLYIAKQLMEKMGGGLEAFNREGGFTIRLWVKLS